MKFVNGDILDAKHGIIGHQVNCSLVMGSGLAKQICDKYPAVFTDYVEVMGKATLKERLGKCQLIQVGSNMYIANLFGQLNYGRKNKQYTDYNALAMALVSLNKWRKKYFQEIDRMPVYLPSGLGSDLGGGKWEVVKGIISSAIPDAIIVKN